MTFCSRSFVRSLRAASTLLLMVTTWSAPAQTAQKDELRQVVSNLRACVRTHAPAAQAAGIQTAEEAVGFFRERCSPPAIDLDPAKVGAIPPGLLRVTVREEWVSFEKTRQR
jgi:hypothetical protein